MKLPILASLALLLFAACSDDNEDVTKTLDKSASVETIMTTEHQQGFDLLKTTHKVWVNGTLDKSFEHVDTLKSLGTILEDGEDASGNSVKVNVPKDYTLFITVQ